MSPKNLYRLCALFTALLLALQVASAASAHGSAATLPALQDFVNAVKDGRAGVLRGVYVPDVLALRIVQQPNGDAAFVSPLAGVATEFGLASDAGSVGLLAHNYQAGTTFSNLAAGQSVSVIYGDGTVESFKISAIQRYQAVDPASATSDFIDLANGAKLSAARLFDRMYTGSRHLTFQTCITKDGDLSWGRLFVIAEPVGPAK